MKLPKFQQISGHRLFSVVLLLAILGISPLMADTQISDIVQSISMDYKIHVDAGKTDCYFQYVYAGAVLYIDYKVLKGGDGDIGISVAGPTGTYLMEPEFKAGNIYHNERVAEGGYYAVCFDNQFSKFSSKLVSLYLTTYLAENWAKYADELESMELSVSNSTASLEVVDSRVTQILQYLHMSKNSEGRDFILINNNNYYVGLFSAIQCCIIIIAGVTHVTILKNLFKNSNPNPHGKFSVRL